ncbi:MAG: transcriptional modulator of MazE/toxin, MazF [Acidobacteria bacterium]|nr:transcriptional modulator of MazE/toxin, MazF [Acidobacteriota bacterium]
MSVRRGRVYVVDFNPPIRTKPGKLRPAVVLQSDLVTEAGYPSTIVVPATTRTVANAGLLRMRLLAGEAGMERDSDLLLGQVIAVANESFRQEIGSLSPETIQELDRRLRIILDL